MADDSEDLLRVIESYTRCRNLFRSLRKEDPDDPEDHTPYAIDLSFQNAAALGFYRDLLGFEVVMDSGSGDDSSWVWISKDGCDLMLNDQYEPGDEPDAPPAERVAWHRDTGLFLGCENVDEVYEYIVSKGLSPELPIVTSYGMKQLNLTDPDGYHICFQHEAR